MEYAFLWSENYMEFIAEVPTQNVHLIGVEMRIKKSFFREGKNGGEFPASQAM